MKKSLPHLLATLSLAAFAPLSAQAHVQGQPELLTNGSFELGAWSDTSLGYMDVPVGSTVITGWTTLDNRVAWAKTPTGDGVLAADGQYSLDLTGFGNLSPNAGVTQTIATVAHAAYTLSFMVHVIPGYGAPAVVLAQAGATTQTFSTSLGGWQTFSLGFTATGPSTAITLASLRQPDTYYVGLDAVSVTAAVPEPGTWALMAVGLGGLAWRRRRAG